MKKIHEPLKLVELCGLRRFSFLFVLFHGNARYGLRGCYRSVKDGLQGIYQPPGENSFDCIY